MLSQGFSVCSCLARNVDPASQPTGESGLEFWKPKLLGEQEALATGCGAGRGFCGPPPPRPQTSKLLCFCSRGLPGYKGRVLDLQMCAWHWGWGVGVCMGRLHCPPSPQGPWGSLGVPADSQPHPGAGVCPHPVSTWAPGITASPGGTAVVTEAGWDPRSEPLPAPRSCPPLAGPRA